MKLIRLKKSDHSWQNFEASWQTECTEYEEDYESYAAASMATLAHECDDSSFDSNTGVFALTDSNGRAHAACFLNRAQIKGYQGNVLRVRHLVLSPYYDFEPLEMEVYAEVMSHYFIALVECSEAELESPHIKIHYRSPYDRPFFAAFGMNLKSTGKFATVESKGMWLHLSKA